MAWEYRVAYVDFRGRVSIEGQEIFMERGERRSAFVRTVLNHLGKDGWELAGVHPLWPAETSYMIFKREGTGDDQGVGARPAVEAQPVPQSGEPETSGPEAGTPTTAISGDEIKL